MPKPSERISEIENQDNNTNRTDAIIQYLDEQHEQNKPCEHKNILTHSEGYDICQDCNLVGMFK